LYFFLRFTCPACARRCSRRLSLRLNILPHTCRQTMPASDMDSDLADWKTYQDESAPTKPTLWF
jgi:hypothetical protein